MASADSVFGNMMLRIIIAAAVLALSLAEIQNQSQESSKQAISSQSFTREDVPISYKFTAIHADPAVRPIAETTQGHHRQYAPIQYAPLHPGLQNFLPNQHIALTGTNAQTNVEWNGNDGSRKINNSPETNINKQHLEPKNLHATANNVQFEKHENFVPGHNVEVLQSVDSNPVHNTVYRSSSDDIEKSPKLNKINYLRQYIVHQHPGIEIQTVTQPTKGYELDISTPSQNSALYTLLGKHYSRPNIYRLNESPQQHIPVPHPKNHKLHLNVARIYGFSQPIAKALQTNLIYPSHTYAIPSNSQLRDMNKKTLLFPVINQSQRYLVRTA
ncbi:cuticular protein RR-2 motif 100 isoform X1 [Bombyx mori]|uniref:Cuticle protein n=1 Tax=Bombyx mori TaxID=7091 RepID=A0A8R2GCL2_BOMMO|nr:uncharacterized protein LOC105842418 [Bombyx mori]